MVQTSHEDIELDTLWRKVFGQPLPVVGAPDVARRIIREHLARSNTDTHAMPFSAGPFTAELGVRREVKG